MTTCWINGHIVAKEDACISIFDHGLLYGDGVFEGIRFYNGSAFLLDQHLQRLFDSAKALLLRIPYTPKELALAIEHTINNFGKANGYIRLVVTRGVGALGVDPLSCPKATVFIIADDLKLTQSNKKTQGLRTIIVSTRRVPNVSWDARIKSLNYLNNVLAKLEAHNANADEAIFLNQAGNIAEGALNNVFIVRDSILLTPLATDGALAGITRSLILKLAGELGLSAREQTLTPYDLYTADECFCTGTGIELAPVQEVDGRRIKHCPGPVFSALQDAFQSFIQQQTHNPVSFTREGQS